MEEQWEDWDSKAKDVAPPKPQEEYCAEKWTKSKKDDDVGGDVSMGPGW